RSDIGASVYAVYPTRQPGCSGPEVQVLTPSARENLASLTVLLGASFRTPQMRLRPAPYQSCVVRYLAMRRFSCVERPCLLSGASVLEVLCGSTSCVIREERCRTVFPHVDARVKGTGRLERSREAPSVPILQVPPLDLGGHFP